jgi:hypothetical protein
MIPNRAPLDSDGIRVAADNGAHRRHAIAAGGIPFRPMPPEPRRAQFHVRGRLKALQAP